MVMLGVVIYSLFKRSPKSQRKSQISLNDAGIVEPQRKEMSTGKTKKVKFIKLGESVSYPLSKNKVKTGKSSQNSSSQRYDHLEIIRIARSMLKAGATPEKIKKVLPVSESELVLLKANNK